MLSDFWYIYVLRLIYCVSEKICIELFPSVYVFFMVICVLWTLFIHVGYIFFEI
jgi:hypothetical protein